ncbi:ATP-binding protein [Williamwhitmania taraxaci]|uniref:ORC1/DEAH AAA+ ATPase domain-containing protein n=1 Tax=Williamwhitmania taraxaci TaxID=1640674 RepID=A0A1G6ME02_9BACT|nr:ATP-binding protein [Williamwhitmania taraxaci]SDC53733.1 hypothetical protein SAMN05216323_103552 [Williamwhitmania taraxaci]
MLNLTSDFKEKVIEALLEGRKNYDGSDAAFARKNGVSAAVYSRLKNGERERLLSDTQWLTVGRNLGVTMNTRKWVMARTDVFTVIEEDILFCKEFSKGKICVDDCGIGKTFAAKYLSRTLKNVFYVDAKQAKTKQRFIRLIAKTIGIEEHGRYTDVKDNLKYYLQILEKPLIILDDVGYVEYAAYMEVLELVDSTEGICGWYQIGDDSLQEKIERGINSKKVGFRAMFSRFSKRYTTVIPFENSEKIRFYKKLLRDVISVNATKDVDIDRLVVKCLRSDNGSVMGDLRRAEGLLILNQ